MGNLDPTAQSVEKQYFVFRTIAFVPRDHSDNWTGVLLYMVLLRGLAWRLSTSRHPHTQTLTLATRRRRRPRRRPRTHTDGDTQTLSKYAVHTNTIMPTSCSLFFHVWHVFLP